MNKVLINKLQKKLPLKKDKKVIGDANDSWN
jgi:hypothetical protein